MRFLAELDASNVVQQVIVCDDPEWLQENLPGIWVETTPVGDRRYSGPGWTYHQGTVWEFAPPQPYPSWTLDGDGVWRPPTPYPGDGGTYTWDEGTQTWTVTP